MQSPTVFSGVSVSYTIIVIDAVNITLLEYNLADEIQEIRYLGLGRRLELGLDYTGRLFRDADWRGQFGKPTHRQ